MSVPLTFAREKGVKRVSQKSANTCPKCSATIPFGVKFCTNCGHQI
ncbi:MAG: zinc-ribbon domain-containing protein [Promethearchaeota archaeon]